MHGPDAFSRMFDADDGGSAAPRREDVILPVLNGRHCKGSPELRNVNDICTSRVKHGTDDVVNGDAQGTIAHRDHNVDIELAGELSHSGMHLLGRGNARSNLVGTIAINGDAQGTIAVNGDAQGTIAVNGDAQGARVVGEMPTIEQIGDAQLQDKYCIKVRKDP